MQVLRDVFSRFEIAGELVSFFWQRKLWWLLPMVLVLLIFGLFVVLGQTSAIAPFIYTLF